MPRARAVEQPGGGDPKPVTDVGRQLGHVDRPSRGLGCGRRLAVVGGQRHDPVAFADEAVEECLELAKLLV
jgi:hypothetical protein